MFSQQILQVIILCSSGIFGQAQVSYGVYHTNFDWYIWFGIGYMDGDCFLCDWKTLVISHIFSRLGQFWYGAKVVSQILLRVCFCLVIRSGYRNIGYRSVFPSKSSMETPFRCVSYCTLVSSNLVNVNHTILPTTMQRY